MLNNWELYTVTSPDQVNSILSEKQISVGLITIEDDEQLTALKQPQAKRLFESDHQILWIALLAPRMLEDAFIRESISRHFYDYHTLPLDVPRLQASLGHAYGMTMLAQSEQQMDAHQSALQSHNMVGNCSSFRRAMGCIEKYAKASAPVLINGESGTGKELVARSIHNFSSRSRRPMVSINCGAIPEQLIQSELFGHEKGSFTGAIQKKIGRIEAASGSTLFLDEIGDLPASMQVNLLRFLQEGEIERIGNHKPIKVDVRIVAATHVNLEEAVKKGAFRQDLYYRLNVLSIKLPPLRERPEDIPLLADHFFQLYTKDRPRKLEGFTHIAMALMCAYSWPGNIREMMNRIRRAIVLTESRLISPEDLGLNSATLSTQRMTLARARQEADKLAITQSLQSTGNNISAASRILDISRLSLYRLMDKYNLELQRPGELTRK